MKRFCICVFWEKDGVVRDYFTYLIKGLKKVCEQVVVVVNGKLTDEGRNYLNNLEVMILQRENKGLDFGGWKDAIHQIGYKQLSEYDELILTNNSCYGPIYPFSEMFNEMSTRDCDFWGITKHPACKMNFIKNDKRTIILEHLQSYFLVFKKHMFLSNSFKTFWKKVKYYNDYKKIVGYYETKLTKYFEDKGFHSCSYIDFDKYKNFISNPTFISNILIKNDKLPLLKRKFFREHTDKIYYEIIYQTNEIINYITKNTNYDISLIYNDLNETVRMSELQRSLHLNYILPETYSKHTQNSKVALILYIHYLDMIEYCYNYALSMPEYADIYIITSSENIREEIEQKFSNFHCNKLEIRLKHDIDRGITAYFVTCNDIFNSYDYICCVHDKKSSKLYEYKNRSFIEHCFKCCLSSKDYVNNVLNTFKENPQIGLLQPLQPKFSIHDKPTLIPDSNMKNLKMLYNNLKLSVPFDYCFLIPFESMFWVKSKAIQKLLDYDLHYEDFNDESMTDKETISYTTERIISLVAQDAGYFTGLISPCNKAGLYIDNLIGHYIDIKSKYINNLNFFQKIFSITNTYIDHEKYKQVCLFGIKIIKRKV